MAFGLVSVLALSLAPPAARATPRPFTVHRSPFTAIPAGLMHHPDVSADRIVFGYAGDLWTVPRGGGLATRITDAPGAEIFPKFSPDGRSVAYSGNGEVGLLLASDDLYTVPAEGGAPSRVTHHPGSEILDDWTADDRLLFFSNGSTPNFRMHELFAVAPAGGLPRRLPVPYGAFGGLSEDGRRLAYVLYYPDIGLDWKRYHGGMAPDVWLFDLGTRESKKITDWEGTDTSPMWRGDVVYYLSDAGAGHRRNLWSYDTKTGRRAQLTRFAEYDVAWPSIGPGPNGAGEIVFECGGDLYLLDLATNGTRRVDVLVPAESLPAPREVDAARTIDHGTWSLAPAGDRAAVQARGDVWLLPAGEGAPRNLTATDGAAERDPTWSPDGARVAYFSDASGEYDLYVARADGPPEPRRLTSLGPGFRSGPTWSPDSTRIAFSDQSGAILVCTVATGETKLVDRDARGVQPRWAWSPDSAWIAYTKTGPTALSSIWLYDVARGAARRATSGRFDDKYPAFDRAGDYLYYASTRDFTGFTFGLPRLGDIDRLYATADTEVLLRAPLKRNGTVDVEGIERRATTLAIPKPGGRWSFFSLAVNDAGLPVYSYVKEGQPNSVRVFDPASGEEKTIVEGADGFAVSADGRRLLVEASGAVSVVDAAPGGGNRRAISTAGMKARVDPRAEWRQIFADVWRLFRDYFYDPKMHGVDWRAERERPLSSRLPFRRVAVVLAGGGALGAYEVGVLKVLSKVGLEPAVVAGTSAGAINAVGWVAHGFRTELLERTWMRVRPPTIGMRWATLALRGAGGLVTGIGLLLAIMSLLGSPEITLSRHFWGPAAERHEAISVILDALAWGGVAMLGWLATKLSRPAESWLAAFEGVVDPVQTWRWFGVALAIGAIVHLVTWGTGFPWPHRFSATILIVTAAAWLALRPGSGGDPLRSAITRWLPETRGRGLWGDAARKQLVQKLVRSGDSSLLTEGKTLTVMTALALDTGRIAHFYAGPEPGHGFVERVERGLGEAIRLISPAQVIAAAVASSAIPLAFEPVRIAGREFVDAGQFSNQPLAAVYAARADAAIVVLLAPTQEPPRAQPDEHLLALGARLIEIGHWRSLQQELRELPDGWSTSREHGPARVVVVAPAAPLPGHLIGFDPIRSKDLIEFGERDAWRALREAGWILEEDEERDP